MLQDSPVELPPPLDFPIQEKYSTPGWYWSDSYGWHAILDKVVPDNYGGLRGPFKYDSTSKRLISLPTKLS
ncbi:hypothetical protein [Calycomorphotria hydatis]|uniref:Uncharacterized protein n=1 Tax=Calycomorphotria hydatis TaxID=2528027 RepID=A0A517TBY0_9PLAN|nr:hypothetical protein [Calycomorphotria hydatis]QDT65873.1 hypothetical protein V22_31350 [Calycomorphotria hydatis]